MDTYGAWPLNRTELGSDSTLGAVGTVSLG